MTHPLILSARQMQRIERDAIEKGITTGKHLMERAGEQVVEIIKNTTSIFNSALVLAGPGNNGGDGFVIARLLDQMGINCTVALLGQAVNLKGDALFNFEQWQGKVIALSDAKPADIIIDALFGTGLQREISRDLAQIFQTIHKWQKTIYAVDIPSGICSDRGIVLGSALKATHTISFHAPKFGHYLADGPDYCGQLHIADIDLEQPKGTFVELVAKPQRLDKKSGHKYDNGHALVISGDEYKTGAARLAAFSALRIGAGLVTIASPNDAAKEIATHITAIMLKLFTDETSFKNVIDSEPRFNAIAMGPGLGINKVELIKIALLSQRSIVLDADAISIIANNRQLLPLLHSNCILTPHFGEFMRLTPLLGEELKRGKISKVDACKKTAKELGVTLLIKGRDSVISDGTKTAIHCAAYDRQVPWLATAGSGDCLTGIITGLIARGFSPFEATTSATWLHVEAARTFGPGLIAEDIADTLPVVLKILIENENRG